MGLLELLLLAVGLAMDAFAVSICGSLALAPASRLVEPCVLASGLDFFRH